MFVANSITAFYTTTNPNQTVRLCCHSEYMEICYIADDDKIISNPEGEVLYEFQDTGDHKVVFAIHCQQETLAGMFAFCFSLTAVKFSELSLEYVKDVSGMFAMTALSAIDLSACRNNQIYKMSCMFAGCERLKECRIGELPLKQEDINDVFYGRKNRIHITRYD